MIDRIVPVWLPDTINAVTVLERDGSRTVYVNSTLAEETQTIAVWDLVRRLTTVGSNTV